MSRFLRRVILQAIAELPPWSSAERQHLATPVYDEARRVLQLRDSLDRAPLPQDLVTFLPAIKYGFENVALDCERVDAAGDEARAKVNAWLAELRRAL